MERITEVLIQTQSVADLWTEYGIVADVIVRLFHLNSLDLTDYS